MDLLTQHLEVVVASTTHPLGAEVVFMLQHTGVMIVMGAMERVGVQFEVPAVVDMTAEEVAEVEAEVVGCNVRS